MTAKQRQKLINVIKKDATLCGQYLGKPRTGDACVIGGMALAIKVPRKDLERAEGEHISTGALEWLVEKLSDAYGLNEDQLSELQQLNDSINDGLVPDDGKTTPKKIKERRRKLIELVDSWPVEKPVKKGGKK